MNSPQRSQIVPPPPEHSKSNVRNGIAVAAFSLVAALFIVEIALRIWGFSYRLYPEKIEFGWPNPTMMENRYTPDNELLWVPKDYQATLTTLQTQKPKIIFMGDSCTEFGTYDQFFLSHAAKRGFTTSAAKVGVGGWSSYQGLRQLQRDIVPLRPEVVSIYFGWNDHWMGFGIEDKRIGELRSPLFTLLEHSRFTQLLVKAYITSTQDNDNTNPVRVSESDFRENLRNIVAVSREHNITPLLVTAPSSHQVGKEPIYLKKRHIKDLSALVPMHQRYVTIVREVAAETGAPLCDLAADFGVFSPEELVRNYFNKDGIHLTKLEGGGYDRLAEFLVNCFEKQRLFRESLRH